MIVELVEIHHISYKHHDYAELDRLCFLSKNLYNSTLYTVRQHYFQTKQYLNYNQVNFAFTHENQQDYRTLPAKVAKWIQKQVEQDFHSFFALLKLKQQGKYEHSVKPPKYADKIKGRKKLHYEKGAISFRKSGYLKLSQTNIEIRTNLTKEMVRYVEIVPALHSFQIIIGYRKECPEKKQNGRYASIDLGLNNLATVTSNVMKPYIINGRPLKSINQYANKKIAHFKSLLQGDKKSSQQIKKIYTKRQHKIRDYLHKASAYIVNQLVSKNIHTLILGYNKKWKQDTNMGKVTNQNFVQIPFYSFKEILSYKCRLHGITIIEQEESYTSKCSFLDDETICRHENYQGKRIYRGLFRSAENKTINADVNGSLNIMKKYLIKQEAWNSQLWLNLVEVCSMPNVQVLTCA
ncbi:MAG: transposase [Oscillospiraceae bacterium]|nr:transposase [Oscillospiraceae bacterium]